MKLFLLAISASLALSGCTSTYYSTSRINNDLRDSGSVTRESSGSITSAFGSHNVDVSVSKYEIKEISHKHDILKVHAKGIAHIKGQPYDSSPRFDALVSGKTGWSSNGEMTLHINSASNIDLTGISKLHLKGIRDRVKDIIAMTLIEKDEIILNEIKKEGGKDVRIWNNQ